MLIGLNCSVLSKIYIFQQKNLLLADSTPTEAVAGKDALKEPSMPAKAATGDAESLKQRTESEEDTTGVAKDAEGTRVPGYILLAVRFTLIGCNRSVLFQGIIIFFNKRILFQRI